MPLLFPDDRLAVDNRTGRPSKARPARLFLNEALTQPATVYTNVNGAPGAVIPDAQVTTDRYGFLPLWWGPSDDRDTLWISVNGGPAWPVYAQANARIAALEAGGGGGPGDTTGLVHKAGAETITGVKTFTVSPVVPEPSDQTHAVRRAYADNLVTAEADVRADADTALDVRVTDLETSGSGVPQSYVDNADAGVAADAASALAGHAADTTGVHGIADTSALVLTGDARLSDPRTPTAHATSHGDGGTDEIVVSQDQVTGLGTALDAKADLVGGVIPSAQIPAIAISEFLGEVGSQAAMLALVGQRGDWAIRTDSGTTWIVVAEPTTSLANWKQIPSPGAPVTSVNTQTGTVVLSAANVGALATSSNLSDVANAATARANLGLGTAATTNTGTGATNTILGNDARLSDARTPTSHAASHASGGGDPITVAQSQVTNLTTDLGAKAPLASPALTGTPTAPTASAATNNTQVATTAYVTGAVATLSGTTTTGLAGKVDKGTEWVNVRDYGAAGTGLVDDQPAFVAALAAAGTGGTVFVPKGNYRLDSTLTLGAAQTIQGCGFYINRDADNSGFGNSAYGTQSNFVGAILRSTVTSGNAILHVNTSVHSGGRIQDLALIGPGSGTATGIYMGQDTPTIRAVLKAQYRNVLIANFATGLAGYHVNEASFYDLIIRACTKAISAIGDFNNISWVGLDMQRCGQGWVCEVQANDDYRIIGNTFLAPICQNITGEGFVIRGESNTLISPYFELVGTSATMLRMIKAYYCAVISPTIHGAGTRAIDVDSTSFYNEFRLIELHSSTCTMTNAGYGTVISGQLTDAGGTGLTDTGSHTHRVDLNGATHQLPRLITGTTSGTNPAIQTTGLLLARYGASGAIDRWGNGSPEGTVTAPLGSLYRRLDGGVGTTLYSKETGTGNTGWVALGAGGGGVPTSRTLTAGTGLTGGGDLTADRTFAVAYGTTAGTAAQGNDSRITGAAPLANPTFTGTPAAPTATGGTNTTQIATTAFVTTAAAAKENTITAGTTAQYWRGDKSWQTLDKTAVGLANVDNTSDATKNAATATLTNKTLTSPVINSPTGIVKGDVGLGNVDNTSDATKNSATATLTNKRIPPRVTSTGSSGTPTPNADTDDVFILTALAATATFGAPTGTPTEGQSLILRIKDNGTARTLSWNAIYRAVGVALPTTTVLSKTTCIGLRYNATDTRWDMLAVSTEA